MNLVDTSVWIELLRDTGSHADRSLTRLQQAAPSAIAMTGPVAMELLAGPTDELAARRIHRLVDGVRSLPVRPRSDFHEAAAIQRACRLHGRTVRSLIDCLIAAIALRHGATLVHKDADFAAIAEVTDLDHVDLREQA